METPKNTTYLGGSLVPTSTSPLCCAAELLEAFLDHEDQRLPHLAETMLLLEEQVVTRPLRNARVSRTTSHQANVMITLGIPGTPWANNKS